MISGLMRTILAPGSSLKVTSTTAMRSGMRSAALQAYAARGVHRLEHVLDEILQFFVENRDFLGWLSRTGSPNFTME